MITIDGIIFSSKNSAGGVGVYFRELLREAASVGEDVQVVVHDGRIVPSDLHCTPERVIFRRPRLLERMRSLRGLPKGLLHSSYYRTSAQQDVRNVVTVYDFTHEKFSAGFRAMLHGRQKHAAIMRSDAAICISENTRRDLLEFVPRYPAERIVVTHLAAGDQFHPLGTAKCTLTTQAFVLFVGGRAGYKNFEAAVQAVKLVPEFALVCVGGGLFTLDERAMLESMLRGRYFHAGSVNTATLNELYNSAVCLIYPSLYEGFGIPPLEAMKAGCPFVALDCSSIPEVAGNAGILVGAPDPELFAVAIKDCALTERRAALRVRGLEQARNFSWNKTFLETLSVYRRVLEST